jgi:hypothetical protein
MLKQAMQALEKALADFHEKAGEDGGFEELMAWAPEVDQVEGGALAMSLLGQICGYLNRQGVPSEKVAVIVLMMAKTAAAAIPSLLPHEVPLPGQLSLVRDETPVPPVPVSSDRQQELAELGAEAKKVEAELEAEAAARGPRLVVE